jgi:hypothetical protein
LPQPDCDSGWNFVPDTTEKAYVVDLSGSERGETVLAYRASPREQDFDLSAGLAQHGEIVWGTRVSFHWILINEALYLPMYLRGVQVLQAAKDFEVGSAHISTTHTSTWRYEPCNGRCIDVRLEPKVSGRRSKIFFSPGRTFEVTQELLGVDGVLFLRLANNEGWLFDRLPGEVMCTRLEDKPGMWRYAPLNGLPADVRAEPAVDGKRTQDWVDHGAIFEVAEEVDGDDNVKYLRLANGTGWLFDRRPSVRMCTRLDEEDTHEWVNVSPC